jgi:hypothetical protein
MLNVCGLDVGHIVTNPEQDVTPAQSTEVHNNVADVTADVDYVLNNCIWNMKSMSSRRVYSACCMASGTDLMIRQGTGVGYNMN